MNRIKFGQFILLAAIFMAMAFTSCGEISANFCGESRFEYSDSKEFCFEDEVYEKCEGKIYNALDSFCYKNVLYQKCGGEQVDFSINFCYGNVLYQKCKGEIFNPLYQYCDGGNLKYNKSCPPEDRYGENYNSQEKFCYPNDATGITYDLCDGKEYEPPEQFCYEGLIYPKCGKNDYNPSDNICIQGNLYASCDKTVSGPCSDEGNLGCKNKKDKKTVNPYYGMECDKDGKILGKIAYNGKQYNTVQIGEQVWMAENYGDGYNWARAMNLPQGCNTDEDVQKTCVNGITGLEYPCMQAKYPECRGISSSAARQGLCPSGWSIPNNDEWQKLMDYIGGFFANVLDGNYGFNVKLSGGSCEADGNLDGAFWWASEGSYNMASSYLIYPNSNAIRTISHDKSCQFSIRCLKNN